MTRIRGAGEAFSVDAGETLTWTIDAGGGHAVDVILELGLDQSSVSSTLTLNSGPVAGATCAYVTGTSQQVVDSGPLTVPSSAQAGQLLIYGMCAQNRGLEYASGFYTLSRDNPLDGTQRSVFMWKTVSAAAGDPGSEIAVLGNSPGNPAAASVVNFPQFRSVSSITTHTMVAGKTLTYNRTVPAKGSFLMWFHDVDGTVSWSPTDSLPPTLNGVSTPGIGLSDVITSDVGAYVGPVCDHPYSISATINSGTGPARFGLALLDSI